MEQACKEMKFSLWAYVFMPNHIHLIIRPQEHVYSISQILKKIKEPVAVKAIAYLKENNVEGLKKLSTGWKDQRYRFWQKGGGYDRNINCFDTLVKAVRYIHNNPVRKGLVEKPEDWFYSSAREWMNRGKGPLMIDKEDWPAFV